MDQKNNQVLGRIQVEEGMEPPGTCWQEGFRF